MFSGRISLHIEDFSGLFQCEERKLKHIPGKDDAFEKMCMCFEINAIFVQKGRRYNMDDPVRVRVPINVRDQKHQDPEWQ